MILKFEENVLNKGIIFCLIIYVWQVLVSVR